MTKSLILSLSLFALTTGCRPKDDTTDDTAETDTDTDTDSDTDTDTDADTDSDTDTDVDEATIELSAPADASSNYGTVDLTYAVTNFVLAADKLQSGDTTPVYGEGHVHIKVDGEYMDATADTTYTLSGLASGPHTLSVVLAGNDHTESAVSDSVSVTTYVPTLSIVAPDSTDLDANSLSLALNVSDFTMSSDIGGAAVVGEGHYHLYVDGVYQDYGTDLTAARFTQLSAGTHELTVELVSSDHASLTPPVTASLTVDVADDAEGVWIDKSGYLSEIDSASVSVPVAVTNFTLSGDHVEGANVDGEGHYHVYLDGVYFDYGASDTFTLTHVAAGDHVVGVQLADNDHTETGHAYDYARFSVAADRPDISIYSPGDGEVVTSDFTLQATVENFTLDPDNVGSSTNVDGEGHFHVYVDGIYNTFSADTSVLVSGLDPGDHTVQLELVNNDHSDLAAPVWSEEIAVTVE